MINLIRLDERMIHGQVAIKWSRHTNVNRIVVANDEAASNQTVKNSLMMAAPATVKVAIKSVSESIELLNDPRSTDLKILVIVANPKDLLAILENVKDVPLVNIGNFGRISLDGNQSSRKHYRGHLYANEEELEVFKKIVDLGIKTIYQITPEEQPEPLQKALNL
jgi:Phosphotransferase system, mannose/fructose/N-acetylgalactosamine-specific component IIB